MSPALPTDDDIDELVAFLPQLYSTGKNPIDHWAGGDEVRPGVVTMPRPVYDSQVEAFFSAASKSCWLDTGYSPQEAGRMIREEGLIERATLPQIRTMLTFCVRGERFCDGHWATMVESGIVERILKRLRVLRSH